MNAFLKITSEIQQKAAARGISVEVGETYTGYAFCNLCEINAAKFTSLEDFMAAAWAATLIALASLLAILPRLGGALTARRIGFVFASLIGAGLASAYHAHVAGRKQAFRWVALGATTALVLSVVFRRGAP